MRIEMKYNRVENSARQELFKRESIKEKCQAAKEHVGGAKIFIMGQKSQEKVLEDKVVKEIECLAGIILPKRNICMEIKDMKEIIRT